MTFFGDIKFEQFNMSGQVGSYF